MGERIRAATEIIRLLRRSELKYSFEHAVANILLSISLIFLPISAGSMRWWVLVFVLLVSLAVQGFRVWRYTRRQDREYEERLRRAMQEDADA